MKNMIFKGCSCWFVVAVAVCPVWAFDGYEVTDLGEGLTPVALNDRGQTVLLKEAMVEGHTSELYVWDGHQSSFLFRSTDWFEGSHINNDGHIISRFFRTGSEPDVSYYWKDGNLEATMPGVFCDINNSDQIVYRVWTHETFLDKSYLREADGTLIDCGNVDNRTLFGVALNDMGQITGTTNKFSDGDEFDAFIWDHDQGFSILPPVAGDNFSGGVDINNKREVVGYTQKWDIDPFSSRRLVLWRPFEGVTDLGATLYDQGIHVFMNNSSQIAGEFKLEGDDEFESYIWEEGAGFVLVQELLEDDSPWEIGRLWGINNQGQMIATADFEGEYHGVLLTPVPEPGTLLLISFGILTMRRAICGKSRA